MNFGRKEQKDVMNNKYIFNSYKCTKIIYSDASNTGYVGYENITVNRVSHGMPTLEEAD